MKIQKTTANSWMAAAVLAALGCGLFFAGCKREETVTVQQPQAAPQGEPQAPEQAPQYVTVQEAPPPVIVETQPPAPSGDQVWITGSWNWDNNKYTWQAGRYEAPPEAGAVWIAPRYDHDAKGYRYAPGQWSKHDQPKAPSHEPESHEPDNHERNGH